MKTTRPRPARLVAYPSLAIGRVLAIERPDEEYGGGTTVNKHVVHTQLCTNL